MTIAATPRRARERRAVSIDFFVRADDMFDPSRRYLAMAERFSKR